ncbi:hypothetical protein CLU79DRAFT_888157 [Phycomyces nitens]|nr:hypothetical protein CLU79DRAFT_888157 [Phycomyces nitens]
MPRLRESQRSSRPSHPMESEEGDRLFRSLDSSSRFWQTFNQPRDGLGTRASINRIRTSKVTDYPWPQNPSNDGINPSSLFDSSVNGNTMTGMGLKYDWRLHSLLLCRHILTRGLMDGIGSDIQVHVPAWDKVYSLHRLILDQNPYFSVLLQGGFCEASSDSVTLCFENNPFITSESFYFVLTQLYGKLYEPNITQENVRQILATCSFFQLDQMCESAVEFILKTLNTQNVVEYLIFADENAVQGSERICDAIFTFLCREAYSMSRECVAELPVSWLKRIIESDAFWVPSEYDRYQFAYQVLDMRHKISVGADDNLSTKHTEADDEDDDEEDDEKSLKKDETDSTDSIEGVHTCSGFDLLSADTEEGFEPLKTEGDFEDRLHQEDMEMYAQIIQTSIHYMHMTFEQLESIRNDIHPFTSKPLVPPEILQNALWQQIQLRAKIEGATEWDTELGMIMSEPNDKPNNPSYLIPTDDTTTYTGESALSLAMSSTPKNKRAATTDRSDKPEPTKSQYSLYPPFRFSVEFSDVAPLKHDVRVYSKTVFYAGSNWNMYIQKTKSLKRGILQLGVYLHRQSVPFGTCNHYNETTAGPSDTPTPPQPHSNQCTRRCTPDLSSFSRFADKRKIVRSWFKIFCPGRGPKHALTLFQSSPDDFTVLQSWGWKSTNLCADEAALSSPSDPNTAPEPSVEQPNSAVPNTPPPLLSTPRSPGLMSYAGNVYEFRSFTGGIAKPSTVQSTPTSNTPGATIRFSVVMGHV